MFASSQLYFTFTFSWVPSYCSYSGYATKRTILNLKLFFHFLTSYLNFNSTSERLFYLEAWITSHSSNCLQLQQHMKWDSPLGWWYKWTPLSVFGVPIPKESAAHDLTENNHSIETVRDLRMRQIVNQVSCYRQSLQSFLGHLTLVISLTLH